MIRKRIGVLGFSAGAHLSAALSTHFEQRLYDPVDAADQVSCRPDFAVIVYPGYLAWSEQNFAPNAEIHVTEKTPPRFIVQAEDDPVHVENSTVYFLALKNAKVPAEMHLYANGGHGYGLRRTELPVTGWPKLVESVAGDDWDGGGVYELTLDMTSFLGLDASKLDDRFHRYPNGFGPGFYPKNLPCLVHQPLLHTD